MTTKLARRESAPTLLKIEEVAALAAECRTVDEGRDLDDKVQAVLLYLRKQGAEKSTINEIGKAAILTARNLGRLLREMAEAGERSKGGRRKKPSHDGMVSSATLADLGMERHRASRAQQLAAVEEKTLLAWLRETEEKGGETTPGAAERALIKVAKRKAKIKEIADRAREAEPIDGVQPCPVVYCDPPWSYDNKASVGAVAEQYDTMPLEDIKALRIPAAEDCTLFMWATSPLLPEAFEVLAAWGFRYRASMVWDKGSGTGNWVLNAHEFLLIATRGDMPCPLPEHRPVSVVRAKKTRHSAKPEIFAEIIDGMYPGMAKVELFAREQREGWTSWGNEIG